VTASGELAELRLSVQTLVAQVAATAAIVERVERTLGQMESARHAARGESTAAHAAIGERVSGIEKSVDERLEALEKLVARVIDEQEARDRRLGRDGKIVIGAATVFGIVVGAVFTIVDHLQP
jgi:tetrahydromethanopterin S-methyltransferase subunit G